MKQILDNTSATIAGAIDTHEFGKNIMYINAISQAK
jgi:hypothetical protein